MSNPIDPAPVPLYQRCLIGFLLLYLLVLISTFYAEPVSATTKDISAQWQTALAEIRDLSYRKPDQAQQHLNELEPGIRAANRPGVLMEFINLNLSLKLIFGQRQPADAQINELMTLATEQDNVAYIARTHIYRAVSYRNDGNTSQAFSHIDMAQEFASRSNDPDVLRMVWENRASIESGLGRFEQALAGYIKALQFTEKVTEHQQQKRLFLLNEIANLYLNAKNPKEALNYVERVANLAAELKLYDLQASIYLNRGYALADLQRGDEALAAYQQALALSRQHQLKRGEVIALINISDYYLTREDFSSCLDVANQSEQAALAYQDKSILATVWINKGICQAALGQVKPGEQLIKNAIAFYETTDAKLDLEITHGELAQLYARAGQYKNAFEEVIAQQQLSRELFQSDREKTVSELQVRFEAAEKEKQIELLERENNLRAITIKNHRLQQKVSWLIGSVILLSSGLILMLYWRIRESNLKLKVANEALEFQSVRDPLTGLYNRRSLNEAMAQHEKSHRKPGGTAQIDGFILLDIDYFKSINDQFGHAAGDTVLIELGKRLSKITRDTDMVLRWGGEEFLVYVQKVNNQELVILVRRILQLIADKPVVHNGTEIAVTTSIGYITLPFSGLSERLFSWEQALLVADLALYLSKVHGRNRAYGVEQLLVPYEQAKELLESDLSEAMDQDLVQLQLITVN